jgi:hypothetical protein
MSKTPDCLLLGNTQEEIPIVPTKSFFRDYRYQVDNEIAKEIQKSKFRDNDIVENPELGIVFRETTEYLSEELRNQMGISRIRRKVVLQSPQKMLPKIYDNHKELNYLTEGSFCNPNTINHSIHGDGGIEEWQYRKFIEDGAYFQEINPKKAYGRDCATKKVHFRIGKYNDRNFVVDDGVARMVESLDLDTISVFNLATMPSPEYWNDGSGPMFIFGSKNKALARYVEKLSKEPSIREMLYLSGWNMDEYAPAAIPVDEKLLHKQAEFFEKIAKHEDTKKSNKISYLGDSAMIYYVLQQKEKALDLLRLSEAENGYHTDCLIMLLIELGKKDEAESFFRKALSRLKYDHPYNTLLETNGFDVTFTEYVENLKSRGLSDLVTFPSTKNLMEGFQYYDFESLNNLVQNKPPTKKRPEPGIPVVVNYPNFQPLRWCHADVGIITDSLGRENVLFFETD